MKTGVYFAENSFSQKFTNVKGKFSTQFMSGDMEKGNFSRNRALDDSVRMGGYELNIRKPGLGHTDMHQQMKSHSEFWIG